MIERSEIRIIREELYELRQLYKKIAEEHIATEEPSPEDIESLESGEGTVGEDEIWGVLDRYMKK